MEKLEPKGICRKCKNPRDKVYPRGKSYCSSCYKETSTAYAEENKDELLRKNREYRKSNPDKVKKWKSEEYLRWHPLRCRYMGMISRCYNANNKTYPRYGGREKDPIEVCDRWRGKDGFANFVEDVYPTWKKGLTLDRWPDRTGNYEPSNVRWATSVEQQNNTRLNMNYRTMMPEWSPIHYPYNVLITLKQFSEEVGIPFVICSFRYAKKADAEWILSSEYDNRYHEYRGHKYSLRELALISKVSYKTLWYRIMVANWDVTRAVEEPA